jgi:uncharacterized protein (UPF0216 family)
MKCEYLNKIDFGMNELILNSEGWLVLNEDLIRRQMLVNNDDNLLNIDTLYIRRVLVSDTRRRCPTPTQYRYMITLNYVIFLNY